MTAFVLIGHEALKETEVYYTIGTSMATEVLTKQLKIHLAMVQTSMAVHIGSIRCQKLSHIIINQN